MPKAFSKLIKPKSIETEFGIPATSAFNWARPGAKDTPTPIRLSSGGLFYDRAEIEEYIARAKRRAKV